MPYSSIDSLPEHVKKYPEKIQRMWMHVFNSVFDKTDSEQRAFKAANAIIGKNLTKFSYSRYGHNAHINYLLDKFLGQL